MCVEGCKLLFQTAVENVKVSTDCCYLFSCRRGVITRRGRKETGGKGIRVSHHSPLAAFLGD